MERDVQRLVDDEYLDVKLYEMILRDVGKGKEARIIKKLYEKERKDLESLLRLYPGIKPRLNWVKLYLLFILYKLFGISFAVKLAEADEEEVLRGYESLLSREKDVEDRKLLRRLIRSTKRYEYTLRSWIKEERLKYMAFVALGVTDAVISLVGTQAGFLGATGRSTIVGIATLLVGVATTTSMAAATYLQAKEMEQGLSPLKAAAYSSLTYLIVTLVLAMPYFFVENPYVAFLLASLTAIGTLAVFTLYTSVVFERRFLDQFKENLLVVALASLVGYALGELLETSLRTDLISS